MFRYVHAAAFASVAVSLHLEEKMFLTGAPVPPNKAFVENVTAGVKVPSLPSFPSPATCKSPWSPPSSKTEHSSSDSAEECPLDFIKKLVCGEVHNYYEGQKTHMLGS